MTSNNHNEEMLRGRFGGCAGIMTAAAMAIAAAAWVAPTLGDGGDCTPNWSDESPGSGGLLGGTATGHARKVRAMLSYDGQLVNGPSGGPFLFVGGYLHANQSPTLPVPVNGIVMWDGREWSNLDGGIGGNGNVHALSIFDDGTGPALYAGGLLGTVGGIAVNGIARWDGESWSAVGPIGDNIVFIRAMTVVDHGDGPALYVGGIFSEIGGVPANRIARWDGKEWSALGGGVNGNVFSMATYDDGTGEKLITGGSLTEAGGHEVNHIAQWDGQQWMPLGDGFNGGGVGALTVMDTDDGPTLVAGGSFTHSGETPTEKVARWTGEAWEQVGDGFATGGVHALLFGDIGDGPTLFASGSLGFGEGAPSSRVAQLQGDTWQPVGPDLGGDIAFALAILDDGAEPILHVGGRSLKVQGFEISFVTFMRWTGEKWRPPGNTVRAYPGYGVYAAEYFDAGNGEQLYVGGSFAGAGPVDSKGLVIWDGSAWSSIGSIGQFSVVFSLAPSSVSGSNKLYVGGSYIDIDGIPMNHIAAWDGSTWSPLGDGVAEGTSWPWTSVFAIEEFDDGSGPMLIVGGAFTIAGEIEASNIAAWDGTSWHALGSGLNGPVNHMAVVDHGNGPSLYVSGIFTAAGGVDAQGLARWDGSQWHSVGSITALHWHWIHTPLASFNGRLIVGNEVTLPDSSSYGPIAAFDGESWAAWSEGSETILAPTSFEIFDDGDGPTLYLGNFSPYNIEVPMQSLHRWDGSRWEIPDWGGIGRINYLLDQKATLVRAMAVSSAGDKLAVGGYFHFAGDLQTSHIAILEGCPTLTPGDINGDGVVDSLDLLLLLDAWGPCPDPARNDCPADLNGDSVVDGLDLLILLMNWT